MDYIRDYDILVRDQSEIFNVIRFRDPKGERKHITEEIGM